MTKAEEIYHRFVRYEWEVISDTMKKSILEAINEALRQHDVSGSVCNNCKGKGKIFHWEFGQFVKCAICKTDR